MSSNASAMDIEVIDKVNEHKLEELLEMIEAATEPYPTDENDQVVDDASEASTGADLDDDDADDNDTWRPIDPERAVLVYTIEMLLSDGVKLDAEIWNGVQDKMNAYFPSDTISYSAEGVKDKVDALIVEYNEMPPYDMTKRGLIDGIPADAIRAHLVMCQAKRKADEAGEAKVHEKGGEWARLHGQI